MRRFFVLMLMASGLQAAEPQNFLFMGAGDTAENAALIARPDIGGVQVVYNWKRLEPEPGRYDFSEIEADLQRVEKAHKKLFLQLQDRFFMHEHRNVPRYLLEDPRYGGGLAPQTNQDAGRNPDGSGWVAMQWNPAVRERFQALLSALAQRFDGRILGINLPETSFDMDPRKPPGPLVAMAVQDATLTYVNPETRKQFTHAEFVAFARDYLGVDVIFWDVSSPWLKEAP
jgi:hypothetical protein